MQQHRALLATLHSLIDASTVPDVDRLQMLLKDTVQFGRFRSPKPQYAATPKSGRWFRAAANRRSKFVICG